MNSLIFETITNQLQSGENVALVMLTETSGSTPGSSDSMMVVGENGLLVGTIGGGKLEFEIINRSIEAIEKGEDFTFEYGLSEKEALGMICGGTVKGYVKILRKNKKLLIFGSGHVGQNIAELCKILSFDVFVIDQREEFATLPNFSKVKQFFTCEIDEALNQIKVDENCYIIIATKSHSTDYIILRKIIELNSAFIGMLGSKKKVLKLIQKLEEDGVSKENIEKLNAPVGLDISNGSVGEIAVSIIAQILQTKNKTV